MSDNAQPLFNIQKLYVKDLSLEIPHAPQIFLEQGQPDINVQIHSEGGAIENEVFEVNLTITVTAKLGEKTMFLVEANQAGIFRIANIPQEDMEPLLGIGCPNILFPYAREVISDVVTRAGFPPVVLAPVNFEGIYAQRMQQQAGASGEVSIQ